VYETCISQYSLYEMNKFNLYGVYQTGKTTTIASSVSCPQSIHVLQDVEVERDRKDNLSCRKHREAMILIIITLFCIFAKIVIQIIEMVQL